MSQPFFEGPAQLDGLATFFTGGPYLFGRSTSSGTPEGQSQYSLLAAPLPPGLYLPLMTFLPRHLSPHSPTLPSFCPWLSQTFAPPVGDEGLHSKQ